MARINVVHLYQIGIDSPVVCMQCKEKYCMDCPSNAITLGRNGQIVVSPTLCTLCGKCERNCPIGAIHIFNNIVYVCDLCGGSPKCVEICTEGAITYKPESQKPSFAHFKDEVKGMNPSEKQVHYIETKGRDIRKKWRRY
jgi:carbon-monoxide dehydrogenase iron sulfur subunit